ncbi:Protein-tyrosine phosphatase-like protein [Amanita muscaria]
MNELEPLDPVYVAEVLSHPPFVTIEGVINVRDLGHLPSTRYPGKTTRPNLLFRSAELSRITDEGKAQLKQLGITTVFDTRADIELTKYNAPLPSIDGVTFIRAPVFQKEDYSPESMAKRFQLYASGKTEAFMELYSQILDHGGPCFGAILRHVRDRPTEGCLFHCTAGKDRTGVVAAIILKLAGVDHNTIARDYSLTRIGREPARAFIMNRLSQEPIFAENNEAALNMFTCRSETMIAFLDLLDTKYGGIGQYLKSFVGFSDVDIAKVRENILIPASHRL